MSRLNRLRDGDRVLVFGRSGEVCLDRVIYDVGATAIQPIGISEDNPYLVISYWIKIEGTLTESDEFEVHLGNDGTEGPNLFGFLVGSAKGWQYRDWTRVQHIVTKDARDFYVNDDPLFLEFRGTLFWGDATVYIDGVKVQEELEVTQAAPMPSELRDWTRGEQLTFTNFTSGTISTMLPNGTGVKNYEHIPEDLSFFSSWIDENTLAVPRIVFFPSEPADPDVVPARATNLIQYNLNNTEEERLYFTVGIPGEFYFNGSLDNRGATDVEVRDTDWDSPRNRMAMSIWARERSPEFVSDPYCTLTILDANTWEVLHEDTPGIYPKWSKDGRLAYFWDGALHVASVNGRNFNAEQVYENGFNLMPALDWSPDGRFLAMAEKEGAAIINNRFEDAYSIKILDLNTGAPRTLVSINQGELQQDLNWSPDGNFILYTLTLEGEKTQIWWVDVRNGSTGPITNTINAGYANWSE